MQEAASAVNSILELSEPAKKPVNTREIEGLFEANPLLLPSPKLIITLENQGYMAILKAKLQEIKQYSAQHPALIPVS